KLMRILNQQATSLHERAGCVKDSEILGFNEDVIPWLHFVGRLLSRQALAQPALFIHALEYHTLLSNWEVYAGRYHNLSPQSRVQPPKRPSPRSRQGIQSDRAKILSCGVAFSLGYPHTKPLSSAKTATFSKPGSKSAAAHTS